jgi:ferredoxin-fold anticodon binding domain-containing protein
MEGNIKLQGEEFETNNKQHKFRNKLSRPSVLLHRFLDQPIHLHYVSSILQRYDIGIIHIGQGPQMFQNLGVTRRVI